MHPDHNNGNDAKFIHLYKQFENFKPSTTRLILIDGHHTVIAKKINGQNKVYCKVIEQ